ncbi:hypothetical protein MRX96_012392 [Rhipicephalus microplus]
MYVFATKVGLPVEHKGDQHPPFHSPPCCEGTGGAENSTILRASDSRDQVVEEKEQEQQASPQHEAQATQPA